MIGTIASRRPFRPTPAALVTGENYAHWYRGGQFGRIRPRNKFSWRDRTWGAWQVGARYSEFDGNEFSLTAPSRGGSTPTRPRRCRPTGRVPGRWA